jgi:hypothetical protein
MEAAMNRYWLRIALGVLLVFALGLSGMAAVRRGKTEVRHFLATAGARIPLQLANLKFRFEGRTVGRVTGIDIKRIDAEDTGTITLKVRLSDAADLASFGGCTFTIDDVGHLDRTGFRCADKSELDAGDLVRTGEMVFEPGTLTRPLYLRAGEVSRWRHSDIRSLDASLATIPNGGVQARGRFDLRGHEGAAQRGSFSMTADSQGAMISVHDDQGRSLIDFRADQNGVNLNVRDRHGRNLIKLLADSLGAALKVRGH